MNDVNQQKDIGLPSISKCFGILAGVYGGLRLLFRVFPELKTLFFVRPTGELVALFWGRGVFDASEWIYEIGGIKIVLGELCSGTTFFCLLFAYITMKRFAFGQFSIGWIVACYPLSILVNVARVLSLIYVHGYTMNVFSKSANEYIHLFVGVVVFFISFMAVTLIGNRRILEKYCNGSSK